MKLAELFEANIRQLSQAKHDEMIWKMDKWMPDDRELQDEYYNIDDGDIDAMAEFLEMNANEDILARYGFKGDYKLLAQAAFRGR